MKICTDINGIRFYLYPAGPTSYDHRNHFGIIEPWSEALTSDYDEAWDFGADMDKLEPYVLARRQKDGMQYYLVP